MKKLIVLALCGMFCLTANAQQTRLKANAAYWLVGIVNVSVETSLAGKFTFNGDVVYSPWKSVKGNGFHFMQIIPEVRYYPRGGFNGFYVGAYVAHHRFFRITKWNYINKGYYQVGNGYSAGAVIGLQVPINQRWSLDVYAGGGFQDSGYRGYHTRDDSESVGWNRSGEWLPYKLGISFALKL